mgnify:CR=1 FL=1
MGNRRITRKKVKTLQRMTQKKIKKILRNEKFVEADLYGCAGGAVFGPFAAGAAGLLCSAMEAYSWPENECYRYTMTSNN